jgi:hypothetical protein
LARAAIAALSTTHELHWRNKPGSRVAQDG